MNRGIRLAALCCCFNLGGCTIVRAVDDAVSPTLEKIPGFKAIGIVSRQTQEKEKAAEQAGKPSTASGSKAQSDSAHQATPLSITLQASDWINPDSMQGAAPVRIRIFELEKFAAFSNASSMDLISDPAKALGAELRRFRDVIIAPGERMQVNWTLDGSGYVGVLADFRTPGGMPEQSRQILAVDEGKSVLWRIQLDGNTMLAVGRMPDVASGAAADANDSQPVQKKPDAEVSSTKSANL
jgi:type VI secretion system VasD/TssJ family lipoprotein